MSAIYLYREPGTPAHLRAEVRSSEVILVSHEPKVTEGDTVWLDRVVVALSRECWLAVAKAIEPPDDYAAHVQAGYP